MTPRGVRLPDGRVWLRVADPAWREPFDSGFSREHGGRWNPPGSHATLYLNGDIATCRKQIERMLTGFPVHIDDLDDHAFMLAAATLPRAQTCADAVTHEGIRALGLPESYPAYPGGRRVPHDMCTAIGVRVRENRLRGVWCRSAATLDGRGRELAWFPATSRSIAVPVWDKLKPLSKRRHASGWADLGLDNQPRPR